MNSPMGIRPKKIWSCKIGETRNVPHGGDLPMREAIEDAFLALTGESPEFIFSGWGGELTIYERAVAEDREPTSEEIERDDPGQLRATVKTQADDLAILAAAADISRDCSTCTGRPIDKSSAPCGECNDYYSNYRQSPSVVLAIKYRTKEQ